MYAEKFNLFMLQNCLKLHFYVSARRIAEVAEMHATLVACYNDCRVSACLKIVYEHKV